MAAIKRLAGKKAKLVCDCGLVHEFWKDDESQELELTTIKPTQKKEEKNAKGEKAKGGDFFDTLLESLTE